MSGREEHQYAGGMPGGFGGHDNGPGGIYSQLPQQMQQHQYLSGGAAAQQKNERGWGERMVYEAGVTYLAGIFGGGLVGTYQGFRKPIGTGNTKNFKLRLNAVLNASGKIGSSTANSLGVFAMMFSVSRSLAKYLRDKNDIYNEVIGISAAGAMTAMPKGPVAGIASGLTLGAAACVFAFGRYKGQELIHDH